MPRRCDRLKKMLFIKIAIYVFGDEWRFFFVCTCKNEKNVVTLHREPALGMSAHQRRRVADIIKRRLLALVLEHWNPAKFRNPKQESGKCPLVCFIRCISQR